ncbi:MAG TPA: head decoration protein [Acidocella sp.]|jgi:hypothetical protein|uniref:head decoration protein n=1 Tax=Acidocella sp. TaxID=50710 RepID=UPI002CDC4F0B|nr:head decoration protein [Acidocella sp.]HVE20648.1 head decoration protein [Acidocella sp.]
MVSPVIYEQYYDGAFMVSEANGHRSRDLGDLNNSTASDILYEGGLVVAQQGAGIVSAAHGTNTGNGTIGSLSVLQGAEFGTYTLTATSATEFNVVAPSGDLIGEATVGTAFADQVGFTLTAGSTAFVAGDSFTLDVTQQMDIWESWTGGAITGAMGILYNRVWVEAGTSKKVTIVTRACEVNLSELQWDPAVTSSASVATLQAQALAALATMGVIAR